MINKLFGEHMEMEIHDCIGSLNLLGLFDSLECFHCFVAFAQFRFSSF
jgi:hypothetical protein